MVGYDLKLLSFKKMQHKIYKKFHTFKKSYLLKNHIKKIMYWDNYKHLS
jgi:hypothetical protein